MKAKRVGEGEMRGEKWRNVSPSDLCLGGSWDFEDLELLRDAVSPLLHHQCEEVVTGAMVVIRNYHDFETSKLKGCKRMKR